MRGVRSGLVRCATLVSREATTTRPRLFPHVACCSLRPQFLASSLRTLTTTPLFSTDAASTSSTTTSSNVVKEQKPLPPKEVLLRIDWMLENVFPKFMKSRLQSFFDVTQDDLEFEDKLYNVKLSSKAQLVTHIAKIRAYFRWMSPYNKIEQIGSLVYENDEVVVVLWRLSTLKSSLLGYLPEFITRRKVEIQVREGALDFHITPQGQIYKIVNRKVSASDLEGAKVMAANKASGKEQLDKEELKKMRREFDDVHF